MSHFIYHDLGRIEYEKALERQDGCFQRIVGSESTRAGPGKTGCFSANISRY